jgi:hypothetical protein
MCIGLKKKWVPLIRAQGTERRKVNPREGEGVERCREYYMGEWFRESGVWDCCVWLASPRFAAEALVAHQLCPAGRSRGATLA